MLHYKEENFFLYLHCPWTISRSIHPFLDTHTHTPRLNFALTSLLYCYMI